jgi:prepilin-type N-terminal cleavage/methylation domain-containing protein
MKAFFIRESCEKLVCQAEAARAPAPPFGRARAPRSFARVSNHFFGFTLVEVLVVVAVIAVLASLLLPSLSRAKQKAYSALCKSKLHQMGIAVRMYVEEHDGNFPFYFTDSDGMTGYWWERFYPYISIRWTNRAFHCPSYTGGLSDGHSWAGSHDPVVAGSYAYNARGTLIDGSSTLGLGWNDIVPIGSQLRARPVSESRVLVPSQMFVIADSRLDIIPGFTNAYGFPELIPYVAKPSARDLARHGNGDNSLSCDGHVELVSWKVFSTPGLRASDFNNDHQAHPETWSQ